MNLFLSGIKYILMKFTDITLYCSDKLKQDRSVLISKLTTVLTGMNAGF